MSSDRDHDIREKRPGIFSDAALGISRALSSHEELDRDEDIFEEVRNVARAVSAGVALVRAGALKRPDEKLSPPRQK